MEDREKLPTAIVFRHDELDMWLNGQEPHVQVKSPIGVMLVEISVKEAHRILEAIRGVASEADKVMAVVLAKYPGGELVMGFSVLGEILELQRNTMTLPPTGPQDVH